MLQMHLKVVLHCPKSLPFIYFHCKNISDQPSVNSILNKRWRCNKMLLFHLSLPFYLKNSNFLYWIVPYHMQIYPDKTSGCKIDIFDIIEKKCDFVCFGYVNIRYNINDCVHLPFQKSFFFTRHFFRKINISH